MWVPGRVVCLDFRIKTVSKQTFFMNLSQCARPLLRLFGNFFFHRQLLFNGATLKSSCHFTHAAWMRRQENLTLNGEIEMMMAVSNLLLPIAHLSEISKKCNFSETKTEKIRFQSMRLSFWSSQVDQIFNYLMSN